MIAEISIKRKNEIKEKVIETLSLYCKEYSLPLNLTKLIKNIPNVKLITFSSQIQKNDISYEDLIIDAQTSDSYAVCDFSTKRYCIYINDVDPYIMDTKRYRWNTAHELGHVILKHHYITNKDTLRRYYTDDETYRYLETEADYFAQLILVPHACLCNFNITKPKHIALMCKISDTAAKRRFYDYKDWHEHISKDDAYDSTIFNLFYKFSFKRKCPNCNHIVIQRYGKHCIFCGEKKIEWSSEKEMKYESLESYESGKLIICPICNNEETNINGQFCQICGTFLVNTCTNTNCQAALPTNARFCPLCGYASSFSNNNILKPWNYSDMSWLDSIDEELPFT